MGMKEGEGKPQKKPPKRERLAGWLTGFESRLPEGR